MKDNVKKFYPADASKNPDNVLEQSVGCFPKVIVIGINHSGYREIRCSTNMEITEVYWHLQKAQLFLMDQHEIDQSENEK